MKNRTIIKNVYISFLLCFALCILNLYPIHANTIDDLTKIENDLNIKIEQSSKINLYGKDDNVIAEFYRLKEIGYIIIDKSNNNVVEYSTENNNLFINDRNTKYYYGGPLNYFIQTSDKTNLIKLDSQEFVNKDAAILQKNNESLMLSSTRNLPVDSSFTYKTPYLPRTYSYNPHAICGSTASAILLMYYHDHVSSAYVPSNLVSADGVSLVKHLVNYIDNDDIEGSSYSDVVNGLTRYLSTKNVISRVQRLDIVNGASRLYDKKLPIIVGLANHPTYENHWVVGYGLHSVYGLIDYFIVNNGWGQNGININAEYSDGTIVI